MNSKFVISLLIGFGIVSIFVVFVNYQVGEVVSIAGYSAQVSFFQTSVQATITSFVTQLLTVGDWISSMFNSIWGFIVNLVTSIANIINGVVNFFSDWL